MPSSVPAQAAPRLTLKADTAADLMTSNPISVRAEASVGEAIALLTDKGFSAAPVIDTAGRPVGVLSRADILAHNRQTRTRGLAPAEDETGRVEGAARPADTVRAGDIMTPVVLSVRPDTPARRVVEDMVGYQVHRLFVVDGSGVLVGVISSLDVVKRLRP